jgi:TonB family protein
MMIIARNKKRLVALLTIWVALASLLAAATQVPVKPVTAPPKLIADLKSKDAATRRAAANQLGAIRARDSVRPLIGALADADISVREAAAFALGQIANPQATAALTRTLSDRNAETRASAAFALGMIGDRKAMDAISNALTDPDATVRSSAAAGLGVMQDEEAVDELIALLDDPSYDVRYDAVWALGQIGEPDAGDHLRAAIANLDSLNVTDSMRELFRQAAQTALANLRTADKAMPTRPRRAKGVVETDLYSRETQPASIREVALVAPTERALRAKAAGSVGLRVLVGADGRAARAYVTRRLGYGLDQRAVEAVLGYKFEPAMLKGLPQTNWMEIEVKF